MDGTEKGIKGLKILIADDEAAIRSGFKEYAEFLGHQVTEAEDGMQAVSLCREQDFDVVVLDVMMPKMDGYNACKEIRKEKDIPVLMLSSRSDEYDKLFGYADSDYVKDFYYRASLSMNGSDGFYAIGQGDDDVEKSGYGNRDFSTGMTLGNFTLEGYSAQAAMTAFARGDSQLIEGFLFSFGENNSQCLISSDLANYNGLSLGDVITFSNPNKADEFYNLTIVGIYKNTNSNSSESMVFSTASHPANLICISSETADAIVNESLDNNTETTLDDGKVTYSHMGLLISGTYAIASPEDYELFCIEVTDKGLSPQYMVTSSDLNSYEASIVPLQNLNDFATTLLFIVLGIGGIVLIIINVFNIRERKYEVGVLTAIGIKKIKVAAQFVTELLVVTFIFLLIGTGIGAAVSKPISNNLLESQISTQEAAAQAESSVLDRNPMGMLGQEETQDVTYISSIDASVDGVIVLQLLGIGLLLTILSSLAAVVFILRYEPLKILSERS